MSAYYCCILLGAVFRLIFHRVCNTIQKQLVLNVFSTKLDLLESYCTSLLLLIRERVITYTHAFEGISIMREIYLLKSS
jgi:hypothetical protein